MGNIGCIVTRPDGATSTAWAGHNIMLDRARSAFAELMIEGFVYAPNALARTPNFFNFGTGTALPRAQDVDLQHRVTAKVTGLSVAIGASGLTARLYCSLGPTEMTGLITEMMVTQRSGATAGVGSGYGYIWAKALINGGTGINHQSGEFANFYWDFVLGTGQQPF